MVLVEYYIVDEDTKEIQEEPFFSLFPQFDENDIVNDYDYEYDEVTFENENEHKKKKNKKKNPNVITQYIHISQPSTNAILNQDIQFLQLLNGQQQLKKHKQKNMSKKEKQSIIHAFQTLHEHISDSISSADDDISQILHIIHQFEKT